MTSGVSIGTQYQRIDDALMGFAGLTIWNLHIGLVYGLKSDYSNGFSIGVWVWK